MAISKQEEDLSCNRTQLTTKDGDISYDMIGVENTSCEDIDVERDESFQPYVHLYSQIRTLPRWDKGMNEFILRLRSWEIR